MAAEIIEAVDGLVRIRVWEQMRIADLQMLQEACIALMDQGHTVRLLIVLENFQGWEPSDDWDKTGFMLDRDRQIKKMAFVGVEQWRDQACAFVAKGLRKFEIEYFLPSECTEAERWLQE